MKKNYLKPEIETAPLFLSACIMSAPGEAGQTENPETPVFPNPAPKRPVF